MRVRVYIKLCNISDAMSLFMLILQCAEYASECVRDIQNIHRHSAYQLLSTLDSVYSIVTPYKPKFNIPSEQLKSFSRIRLALDLTIRSVKKDRAELRDTDTDLYRILDLIISVIREAKSDFEVGRIYNKNKKRTNL